MARRQNSYRRMMGLAGACILMTAAAMAAPTIGSVSVAAGDKEERLFLNWSEAAPVQMDRFPAERQVVFTLQGAVLGSADAKRLALSEGSAVERAKVQEVTLANGETAVQLTLTLASGADAVPFASPNALTILVTGGNPRPAAAPVSGTPSEGFTLTNADLDVTSWGSADAPLTGAGQASDATSSNAAFFVPPDVDPKDRLSEGDTDQSLLRTNEKFREVIKNLDVKDGELLFVLRGFAKKANMNIIVNPADVKGRITVSLQGVTIGDALDSILKANELAYKIEPGGIIRIVKRSEVRAATLETVTQSIPINWISAANVKTALTPFLSEEVGRIEIAEAANHIIIQEVPENMTRMQELIKQIDAPQKQVKMEVRMVDLTDLASRQLGFRTTFDSTDTKDISTINEGGEIITTPFPVTSGGAGRLGGGDALNITHQNAAKLFGNEYDLGLELDALEERNEAVILANPVLMSLDNQTARLEIIAKIPYLNAEQTDSGSVATVETRDSGVTVDITPRITNNGYVQMTIRPNQLIFRRDLILAGGGGRTYPLIDERHIVTSVIVKDEDTVALGGLRQFESLESDAGVPYLMRIPFLSWLFKSNSSRQNRTELVLFVTPRILKDMTPTQYEKALYDKIDYNWDLPDYYFDQVKPRKSPNEVDPSAVYGR